MKFGCPNQPKLTAPSVSGLSLDNRLAFIDGHRGLAILLVFFYHSYVRWPALVPYGEALANVPVFKAGWVGVQLFFLVSGFVILLTLERCSSGPAFLWRRWLRLFPAMLISTAIIYLTCSWLPERPAGDPHPLSILPGLTFIDDGWWRLIPGFPHEPLEGAFWSLYVEFKFYVAAALVYFWRGRLALLVFCNAAYLLWAVAWAVEARTTSPIASAVLGAFDLLSFKYFGWFAAGSAFYVYAITKDWRYLTLALGSAFASCAIGHSLRAASASCLVVIFFASSLTYPSLQRLLGCRPLLWFGYISYPLYLIHENMGIAIIIKLDRWGFPLPSVLLPLIALAFVSVLALVITTYGETYLRWWIQRFAARRQTRVSATSGSSTQG